jgi:hypothetical protein
MYYVTFDEAVIYGQYLTRCARTHAAAANHCEQARRSGQPRRGTDRTASHVDRVATNMACIPTALLFWLSESFY